MPTKDEELQARVHRLRKRTDKSDDDDDNNNNNDINLMIAMMITIMLVEKNYVEATVIYRYRVSQKKLYMFLKVYFLTQCDRNITKF